MTEIPHLHSTRRFLATPGAAAPGDYWSEVFSRLHARARGRLESWSGVTEWIQVSGVDAVPRGAGGAVLTHSSHRIDLEEVVAGCLALQERDVERVFLVLDHQPRALRSLAGSPSERSEIDATELLRRIHLETELRLSERKAFRARLCRTELFHLVRASAHDVGGPAAKDFHGCRDLYQVLGPRPTHGERH